MRQTPSRRKEGNGKSNGKKREARPVEASGTRTARLALRNAHRAQIARKGVPYKFKSNGKKQEARLALRNARRAQIARKGVPYEFKGNGKSKAPDSPRRASRPLQLQLQNQKQTLRRAKDALLRVTILTCFFISGLISTNPETSLRKGL
jgi:hypothetical protein